MKVFVICLLIGIVAISQMSARGIGELKSNFEEMIVYDSDLSCSGICNEFLGWTSPEVISQCIWICEEMSTPLNATIPPYTDIPPDDYPTVFQDPGEFNNILAEVFTEDVSCSGVCNDYFGWASGELISICIKICQVISTPESSTTPPYYPTDFPTDNYPSDSPTDNYPTDFPTDNYPSDFPTGDLPTGDFPTGDLPTGDFPTGDLPTGDFPTGDLPTGDFPTDFAPVVYAK